MTGSEPRRRWVLRPRPADDQAGHRLTGRTPEYAPALIVEVTSGVVNVSTPGGPVRFGAHDVERIRAAMQDARTVALTDRGR